MTTTPPTPDAAGPVEAVLAEHPSTPTPHGPNYCPPCTESAHEWVQWTPAHVAAALAPLFAEHGAAERRAGAVDALNEAERRITRAAIKACQGCQSCGSQRGLELAADLVTEVSGDYEQEERT